MSNHWCKNADGVNAAIVDHFEAGMTLEQLDEAICQALNVMPPPSQSPRPTGTYTSMATLRAWYLANCTC